METLLSSLLVLAKEWPGLLGMLGVFFLGAGSVYLGLKAVYQGSLTGAEIFAISTGGALLPLLVGALLTGVMNLFMDAGSAFVWIWGLFFACTALAAARAANWRICLKIPEPATIALVLITFFSIFFRLTFIRGLQVPLYFDSAMHYSIITDLIRNFQSSGLPSFQSFVGGYYHLGFHVLSGAFSLVLDIPAQKSILLFGQILLALLPVPVFFIVRRETKLDAPAILATLLAGWGWYMPQHMLDWGKYPALSSLLSFEFVICSLILLPRVSRRTGWMLASLTVLGAISSTFFHSRSLVLISMAIASILIAQGWSRLSSLLRNLLFALIVAALLGLALYIQSRPVLNLALDPYLINQGWMGLLVLVLLPLAYLAFPRATFACLLFTLFLGAGMLISVTLFFPIYKAQTLLDRPYVEGVLFLPLAVLGGLGYAGWLTLIKNSSFWQTPQKNQIMALAAFCLFVTLGAHFTRYNFAPSDCCKLYTEQDAAAFEWLKENTPANTSILIAAFRTVVFESDLPADYSGADAGIWITPFIKRKVILTSYETDFSSQIGLDEICKQGGKYIYAGATNPGFNKTLLESRPEWYARQLSLPGIQIYQITGCQ
jgi:hypothetical protein